MRDERIRQYPAIQSWKGLLLFVSIITLIVVVNCKLLEDDEEEQQDSVIIYIPPEGASAEDRTTRGLKRQGFECLPWRGEVCVCRNRDTGISLLQPCRPTDDDEDDERPNTEE